MADPVGASPAQLELREVTKCFGGLRALDDVSIGFERGQVTCIIGPNGAGKTTLFNVITGFLKPDGGEIVYKGRRLNGLPPHAIARLGVGRLFQDVRVFARMTLLENVGVATRRSAGESPLVAALWPLLGLREEEENLRQARSHLEFVGLSNLSQRWADHLSFGQQKLLAIARLLNNKADCLLLDEPTAGVNPELFARLLDLIRRLAGAGKAVVVIEHNLRIVREMGNWVYLMDRGCVEAFGTPEEILRDSALVRLFPSI